jgi:hypothetical protein
MENLIRLSDGRNGIAVAGDLKRGDTVYFFKNLTDIIEGTVNSVTTRYRFKSVNDVKADLGCSMTFDIRTPEKNFSITVHQTLKRNTSYSNWLFLPKDEYLKRIKLINLIESAEC